MPRTTQDTTIGNALCPYRAITVYGPSFQRVLVHCAPNVVVLQPRCRLDGNGLGQSDFARRYSRNHFCFLFLRVLRCFSSPGLPPDLTSGRHTFSMPGCPIRIPADRFVCADPRGFSQLIASFFASESLGIPHAPLFCLLYFLLF